MIEFYVTDQQSVNKAKESVADAKPITIRGILHGKLESFTGVVQSVDELTASLWRIMISDGK